MPVRLIREGILSSEGVCSLSWAEEVFYRRLMSVVDDYGRFHALPKLLRSSLYPLQFDKVSDSDIGKWLSACETAGLVRVYPALDGKRYVEILKFGQTVRSKSKFPEPFSSGHDGMRQQVDEISCLQVPASAHLCVFEDVVDKNTSATLRVAGGFEDFWSAYPKRKSKGDAVKAWNKLRPDDDLIATILRAIEAQKLGSDWSKDGGQFIPYPASWLNARRWEDEIVMQTAQDRWSGVVL